MPEERTSEEFATSRCFLPVAIKYSGLNIIVFRSASPRIQEQTNYLFIISTALYRFHRSIKLGVKLCKFAELLALYRHGIEHFPVNQFDRNNRD